MGRICIRRTIQRICGLLPLQVQFLFWFPEKGKLGAGRSNHHEMGAGGGAGERSTYPLWKSFAHIFGFPPLSIASWWDSFYSSFLLS